MSRPCVHKKKNNWMKLDLGGRGGDTASTTEKRWTVNSSSHVEELRHSQREERALQGEPFFRISNSQSCESSTRTHAHTHIYIQTHTIIAREIER